MKSKKPVTEDHVICDPKRTKHPEHANPQRQKADESLPRQEGWGSWK